MLQITILRNGTITNAASFESQELLDSWYATHVESFGVHEAIIEDITSQLEVEKQRQESLAYLAATDWMIIRFHETGTEYPVEVKAARAEARAKIL